jgi:hypothetical protein
VRRNSHAHEVTRLQDLDVPAERPHGNEPVGMTEGADMGDKGGKKDKDKNKQQLVKRHQQEQQQKQDKARPKRP